MIDSVVSPLSYMVDYGSCMFSDLLCVCLVFKVRHGESCIFCVSRVLEEKWAVLICGGGGLPQVLLLLQHQCKLGEV